MFRNRVIRPSFLEADAQLLEHFILLDDVVIVMHPLAQSDNWNIYDRFTALEARYRDRFTFLIGPSVTESRSAAVICYNNLDDVNHVATDTQTIQALEDFVVLCAEPLIPELTIINKAEYISVSILARIQVTERLDSPKGHMPTDWEKRSSLFCQHRGRKGGVQGGNTALGEEILWQIEVYHQGLE